jgi:hypothetical protein
MKTMAAIDLSMTKEVPLDAGVNKLQNNQIEVAMIGLGERARHCLHTT